MTAAADIVLTKFKHSKSAIRHFFLKKSVKNTLILGLILIVYMYSKADSFVKTYPNALSREKLVSSLGSNVGIEALLGIAHRINTLGGFAVWNFLCLIAAGGAVWGLLFATKSFRGQEDSGGMELFLAGQTTSRRASVKILEAIVGGLVVLYALLLIGVLIISRLPDANFALSSSMFFALALSLGAVEFLAVGALTSQLMPTRSKAAGLAAIIFGLSYFLRLAADTSSARWLLNLSPLGWIEKLQPMYGSNPVWLIPIFLFVLIVSAAAIYLAGKRDLYGATFADKQSVRSHKALLGSAFLSTIRINRAATIAWMLSISAAAFLYSLLAKGAVESFAKTASVSKGLKRLADTNGQAVLTTKAFMGIVFIIVILSAMFYVAQALGRIRDDEALGYLDNFLVRPFSRYRWLSGRVVLIGIVIVILGLLISLSSWLGLASQHSNLAFSTLLSAGINAMVPVLFVLAFGILIFGIWPRLTRAAAYIVIGWSFLITMLSSGVNLNHWLLDTSIFHQIALAPAVNPNWHLNSVILIISAVLIVLGFIGFNNRDLVGE